MLKGHFFEYCLLFTLQKSFGVLVKWGKNTWCPLVSQHHGRACYYRDYEVCKAVVATSTRCHISLFPTVIMILEQPWVQCFTHRPSMWTAGE